MGKVLIYEVINGSILSVINSYGVKLRIGTVCSQGVIDGFKQDAFSAVSLTECDVYAKLKPYDEKGRPVACLNFHVDVLRILDKKYSEKRRRILLLKK